MSRMTNAAVILIATLVPCTVIAQAKPAGQAPSVDSRLAEGHAKYLAGDFQAALESYQAAKDLEPGRAVAYYFIGWAMAGLERFDDAIVQMKTAVTVAGAKDETTHGKALFAIAVIEERRGEPARANDAWVAYLGFAQTHTGSTTYIASAKERIAVVEKKMKLDESYRVVRERIGKKGP